MTITVNQLPLVPSGDAIQMFCAIDYPTIADLVMSSNSIYWYDSLNGGAPLASNILLIDGTTLYCSSFDNVTLCENPIRTPVQIQVDNPPLPNIESSIEFCLENQFTTQAIETNGVTMNWYDNIVGGNLIASDYVLQDGDVIYGAAYNSITDCESDSRIVLDIVIKNSTLNFYNLITIDDNNLNKELIIEGIEQFPNNSIEIYNRYGNLVWYSDNYNNLDNTFKGQSNASGVLSQESYLPTGTYFLIISYPNDCEKALLKGFIQIDNKL